MSKWPYSSFFNNLQLSSKGAVVVFAPLIVSIVFLFAIASLLREAEYAAWREQRSKSVIASTSEIQRLFLEAGNCLAGYAYTGNEMFLQRCDQLTQQIPIEITSLKKQTASNRQESDCVKRLLPPLQSSLDQLNNLKSSISAGLSPVRMISIRTKVFKAVSTFEPTLVELRKISDIERESYRADPRTKTTLLLMLKIAIWIGVVLNVLIASLLTYFFSRSVTQRVHTIADNTKRLASGEPLNETLDGRDEIASLDQSFHQMSEALNEARAMLEASEARVRSIIENMPVGVVVVDGQGLIESINAKTAEIFRASPRDFSGKRFTRIFSPDRTSNAEVSIETLRDRALNKAADFECLRVDGVSFPAELTLNEISFAHGRKLLASIQDITERRELERLKQEFVSMISHDLRTPLTSIRFFLAMISDGVFGQLPDALMQRIKPLEDGTLRLINLINDMLDLEKMEAGKLTMDLTEVAISDVIERSIEEVRPFAEQYKITLEQVPSTAVVFADEDRLVQVVVNLLSNAIKFSPRDSAVVLSAVNHDKEVKVQVRDSGRGIPARMQNQLFERYKQSETADGKRRSGTGLGLAICKAIVCQLGGTIGVESEEGKGSTFWFCLPLHQYANTHVP